MQCIHNCKKIASTYLYCTEEPESTPYMLLLRSAMVPILRSEVSEARCRSAHHHLAMSSLPFRVADDVMPIYLGGGANNF